jgi:superoxide dismutase, Cu-Zn family
MKANLVRLAAVILLAAAGAAHAASETIIMNSIDANGVARKVGTLDLSDTKAGPPGRTAAH